MRSGKATFIIPLSSEGTNRTQRQHRSARRCLCLWELPSAACQSGSCWFHVWTRAEFKCQGCAGAELRQPPVEATYLNSPEVLQLFRDGPERKAQLYGSSIFRGFHPAAPGASSETPTASVDPQSNINVKTDLMRTRCPSLIHHAFVLLFRINNFRLSLFHIKVLVNLCLASGQRTPLSGGIMSPEVI